MPETPVEKPSVTVPEEPLEELPRPNRATRRAAAKPPTKTDKPVFATFDQLRKKKSRTDDVKLTIQGDDGESVDMIIRIKAIGSTAYDEMISGCPPTRDQNERGATFNMDQFAPALISACALEPPLTYEQAVELYTSDEWASGEIGQLFFACQRVCNSGLDVPFNGAV